LREGKKGKRVVGGGGRRVRGKMWGENRGGWGEDTVMGEKRGGEFSK
jgi:hypothetical protein